MELGLGEIIQQYKKEVTFIFNYAANVPGTSFKLYDGETLLFSKDMTTDDIKMYVTLTANELDLELKTYNYKVIDVAEGEDILSYGDFYLIENAEYRIASIKEKFNLVFDYNTIYDAFKRAVKETFKFYATVTEYTKRENKFLIDSYVADDLNYGFVSHKNIKITQYNTNTYNQEDLTSHITDLFSFADGKTIITMDDNYPSSGYKLKIEYKQINEEFSDVYDTIKKIQDLYTYYYLLDTLTIEKLQLGMTSRTINNVTITFEPDAIQELKKKVFEWIDNEAIEFQSIKVGDFTISNDY